MFGIGHPAKNDVSYGLSSPMFSSLFIE
jgi:hypothetical protein